METRVRSLGLPTIAQYGETAYPGTRAVMVELLDKERTSTDPNALTPAASQHDHNEAVAALLGALVQEKAPPSTEIIATVAGTFPNQAILLASYLPQTAKRSLLEAGTASATTIRVVAFWHGSPL